MVRAVPAVRDADRAVRQVEAHRPRLHRGRKTGCPDPGTGSLVPLVGADAADARLQKAHRERRQRQALLPWRHGPAEGVDALR